MNFEFPDKTAKVVFTQKGADQRLRPEPKINVKDWAMPKTPDAVNVSVVDGVEIKVERTPIAYIPLEAILDELPDFARETIAAIWEKEE